MPIEERLIPSLMGCPADECSDSSSAVAPKSNLSLFNRKLAINFHFFLFLSPYGKPHEATPKPTREAAARTSSRPKWSDPHGQRRLRTGLPQEVPAKSQASFRFMHLSKLMLNLRFLFRLSHLTKFLLILRLLLGYRSTQSFCHNKKQFR